MYTYPNFNTFPTTMGCNTPSFGGTWNQYGWNMPGYQGMNNWGFNTPNYNTWNQNGWNQFGWNTPSFNNWQSPVNGYEGMQPGYGWNTPWTNAFGGQSFGGQYGVPTNWNNTNWNNTNWNSNWNYPSTPFQNTTPFPGLYNFSNSFGQGFPYANVPFSGTTPFNGYPQAFGGTPFVNGFQTPWNFGTPFTPIFWGQMPKVDGEMPSNKKCDVNMQQNRVSPYPMGFGPFVPFGYPNGEFVKNSTPACAA